MLSLLTLQNYRCFDRHEASFREMNIVVGANNAGKSTLVEALRLLSLVTSRYRGLNYASPPSWADLPRRTRGVSPAIGDMDLRGGSLFHRYGDPPARILATCSNGCTIDLYVGEENKVFAVLRNAEGDLVEHKGMAQAISLPSIAILPQIGPVERDERVLTEEYVRRIFIPAWHQDTSATKFTSLGPSILRTSSG